MSLLGSVTWGKRAGLILSRLEGTAGKLGVLGAPALARLLAARGRDVTVARATDGKLLFDDDALAGFIAVTEGEPEGEWQRVVRDGGLLFLIGATPQGEASRRALCAGLADLRAARAGRHIVMSGRVWKQFRPAPAP